MTRPKMASAHWWRDLYKTIRHTIEPENHEIDAAVSSYKEAIAKRGTALVELSDETSRLRQTAIETRIVARDVLRRVERQPK